MKNKLQLFSVQLILIFFTFSIMNSQPIISYKLSMSEPQTHIFEVEAKFEKLQKNLKELKISLPVWRSGRYVLFDFAGDVLTFSANNGNGKNLNWKKSDKSTWVVELNSSQTVQVKYKVYANEFNSRTKGLNSEHAFVDPMSVFVFVEEFRNHALTLKVEPFGSWHVTTGLKEVEKNIFNAPNYDYFADSPLEIGNQNDITFNVDGKEHIISIFGQANYNSDTLKKDFTTLINYNKNFWGSLPYEKYIFMLHISPTSGGGTEHINSTIMGTRPQVFQKRETYLSGFLGLVSHEYFHTWNVKQLRPKGITPYNFLKENYTRELWISEGTTSYFDDLILVRSKFKSSSSYIDELALRIRNDRRRPGNLIQSLSESSFDAWVKYWKPLAHTNNFETDYYEKGACVSFLLDMEIRKISNNKISLDNVMKKMFEDFPLEEGGFTIDDFQKTIENLTDKSFDSFFKSFIHGTLPLKWEEAINSAGLILSDKDSTKEVEVGFIISEQEGKTFVRNLTYQSSAMKSGLDINDEIVAFNGEKAKGKEVLDKISNSKNKVTLTIFRDEKLKEISFQPEYFETPNYKITKVKTPTDLQKNIYETWLGVSW